MEEGRDKVCHYTEVPADAIGNEAPGTCVRRLIDGGDGAPLFALRMIELAPGGHSLHHRHGYEHEAFVLDGRGQVLMGEAWHDLKPGDVVYVPGWVEHE